MILVSCLLRLGLCYLAALGTGLLLYLALIASPLLGGVPILFYRGIAVALLAAPLLGLLLALAARRVRMLDLPTIVGAVALSLAFNISFLIVFPVTFDRSITMFLLARIDRQDGQLDVRGLERVYVREYLGEMRQIDRRIEEQTLSGNIRVVDGRIVLTPQGHRLLASGRRIGGWFGADPRFMTAPEPPGEAH